MNYPLTKQEQFEADYWNVTAFLAAVCFFVASVVGCNPAKTAVESVDTLEQVECADKSVTKEENLACLKAVRAEWAAKDGGAE